jgi:hypothetical protein
MSWFKHKIRYGFIGAVAVMALPLTASAGAIPAAHVAPLQWATAAAVQVRPQHDVGQVFIATYNSLGDCTWNGWWGQQLGSWGSWSCDLWVDSNGTAFWDLYADTNILWL